MGSIRKNSRFEERQTKFYSNHYVVTKKKHSSNNKYLIQ